jgi:FixJ family two-component response regulator
MKAIILSGGLGTDILKIAKETPVIIITGASDVELAVKV